MSYSCLNPVSVQSVNMDILLLSEDMSQNTNYEAFPLRILIVTERSDITASWFVGIHTRTCTNIYGSLKLIRRESSVS